MKKTLKTYLVEITTCKRTDYGFDKIEFQYDLCKGESQEDVQQRYSKRLNKHKLPKNQFYIISKIVDTCDLVRTLYRYF